MMTEDELREGMMRLSIEAGTMPKKVRDSLRKQEEEESAEDRERRYWNLYQELVHPNLDAKEPRSMRQLRELAPREPEGLSFSVLVRVAVNRGWCRKSSQKVRSRDNYLVGYIR